MSKTEISVGEGWVDDLDSPNPADNPTARRLSVHVRFTNVPTGYRDVTLSGWVYVSSRHLDGGVVWGGPYMSQAGGLERSDGAALPTDNMWRTVSDAISAELPTPSAAYALEALQRTRKRKDDAARETLRHTLEGHQRFHVRGLEWVDTIRALEVES